MADDRILFGGIIAAITGMYAFFIAHIRGHATRSELDRFKDAVQYKDNCNEIVKRIENAQKDNSDKLDKLLSYHMKK